MPEYILLNLTKVDRMFGFRQVIMNFIDHILNLSFVLHITCNCDFGCFYISDGTQHINTSSCSIK